MALSTNQILQIKAFIRKSTVAIDILHDNEDRWSTGDGVFSVPFLMSDKLLERSLAWFLTISANKN